MISHFNGARNLFQQYKNSGESRLADAFNPRIRVDKIFFSQQTFERETNLFCCKEKSMKSKSILKARARFAIFVFCAFFSRFLFAQNATLESVCADLSSAKITKGDFTQTKTIKTSSGTRAIKSSGEYLFCGEGIVWNTKKPFSSLTVISKDRIEQTSASGNKNVIEARDNPIFSSIAEGIAAIFSGDIETLKKNFALDFESQANQPNDLQWKIKLVPQDSSFSQSIAQITIFGSKDKNAKKFVADGIETQEISGGSVRYDFSNRRFPSSLNENEKSYFQR